jgi:hypothetical protein
MVNLILGFAHPIGLTRTSNDGTRRKGTWSMARLVPMLVLALLAGFTFGIEEARAGVIAAGYDLFGTDPSTTFVTIGGTPIPLKGVPFIAHTDVDTAVERIGATIPAGGLGSFQIRLVELYLESQTTHTYAGIGAADLYVTRNFLNLPGIPQPDALPAPPLGTLTILTHNDGLGVAGGGTFSSTLPVIVDLIFTKPGGNPNNPSDILASQVDDATNDPFSSTGTWSHTPRFDDPHPRAPSPLNQAGNFYPGVDPTTLGKILTGEQAMLAAHGVLPGQAEMPEPSALILSSTGALLGLGYLLRRKRTAN